MDRKQGVRKVLGAVTQAVKTSLQRDVADNWSAMDEADWALQATEKAVADTKLRMRLHIDEQQRLRDSRLPVHKLPTELLVKIILDAIPNRLSGDLLRKLRPFAGVCRRWAELVKGTPLLWGVVSSKDSPTTRAICISKSKDTPLDIVYDYDSRDKLHFEECILAHVQRWRSASIDCPEGRRFLDRALTSSTQRLEDLIIRNSPSTVHIPEQLLRRLRYLLVQKSPIQWDIVGTPSPAGLKKLEIEQFRNQASPSALQLVMLIRACAGLVKLVLRIPALLSSDGLDNDLIHLPQLRDLSLQLASPVMRSILTRIRVPKCVSLQLISTHGTPVKILDTPTTHLHPLATSILRKAMKATVTVSPTSVDVSAKSKTRSIQTTLQTENIPQQLAWWNTIFDSIKRKPTITLILNTPSAAALDMVFPILRSACPITELQLIGPSPDFDLLMVALYDTTIRDGMVEWPFPHLKRLICEDSVDNAASFLGMVRHRYGNRSKAPEGTPVDDKVVVETGHAGTMQTAVMRPPKLKMLAVREGNGLRDVHFDELEQILGRGKVEWDGPDDDEEEDDEDDEEEDEEEDEEDEANEQAHLDCFGWHCHSECPCGGEFERGPDADGDGFAFTGYW